MIEIQNLSLSRGEKNIFKNYTFTVNQGSCLSIMGVNGIGKSTLLSTIVGLLPQYQGSISINGTIGYVPQLFDMPFTYNVIDIVIMGRASKIGLFSSPSKKDYEIAEQYIELMGIAHLRKRAFNTLSGGQRQMVMIAQALTSQCDIMILDEPCSALDYHNQALVLSRLKYLNETIGITIIYVTHTPHHASILSSHVLLMRGYDDYQYGATEDILNASNLTTMYKTEIGTAQFNDQIALLAPRFDKTVSTKDIG